MSEINLKLKTYDELTFEISRLNTDKYLLEQKLQQKENIIKEVREILLNYGETFDSKIHQQMQKELLGILGSD